MQIHSQAILGENVNATGSAVAWKGGKGFFTAAATAWNSGTVKLQMLIRQGETNDETNWVDVKNQAGNACSFTANGGIPFEVPSGQLRVNISAATGVYSYCIGMHM